MNTAAALKAYAHVGVESDVNAADPHKLILLLYRGAIEAIAQARIQMQRGQVALKGSSISKAISIIESGLRPSLNKEAGGELARNLDELYAHMVHRLITANLRNDPAILDEVSRLLIDLRQAWEQITPAAPAPAQPANHSSGAHRPTGRI